MSVSNLSELAGMDAAKHIAPKLWAHDSGTHAVLIYGPQGSGKSEIADLMARSWLCRSPRELGPCQECAACQASAKSQNVDRLDIAPIGAQRLIKVGQIISPKRKEEDIDTVPVTEFIRTMPIVSRSKVILLMDADRMNEAASNALLKSLEEPPAYVRLILVTSDPGALAATIRSRCVYLSASAPSDLGDRWASIGDQERASDEAERRSALAEIARQTITLKPEDALLLAEVFRNLAFTVGDDEEDRSKRQVYADLLADFADALLAIGAFDKAKRVIQAHQWVLGNANFQLQVDGLFTSFWA